MTTVRIPPVLRQHTGGTRDVRTTGETVEQALLDLSRQFPSLRDQLFDDGRLQRYVNVYVNDQDIQYMEKLATPVGDTDTIIILPAMAGGGDRPWPLLTS